NARVRVVVEQLPPPRRTRLPDPGRGRASVLRWPGITLACPHRASLPIGTKPRANHFSLQAELVALRILQLVVILRPGAPTLLDATYDGSPQRDEPVLLCVDGGVMLLR